MLEALLQMLGCQSGRVVVAKLIFKVVFTVSCYCIIFTCCLVWMRLPIALVLQFIGSMNYGHDAICNMELMHSES